jgi:hypothetical protein
VKRIAAHPPISQWVGIAVVQDLKDHGAVATGKKS